MVVDESPDPALPQKRKRSQETDGVQDLPDQAQDGASPKANGSSSSPIIANGAKRMRVGDRNGHLKKYIPVEIPKDKAELPKEIWQYIFTFLAPPTLVRLLAVNRKFNTILSNVKPDLTNVSSIGGYFKTLDSDSIWSVSRRLFFANMPRPLASHSELTMWRLISGRTCQICRKKESQDPGSISNQPWTGGPGLDGVRIIWPFGVRSCGACLQSRMKKEMDVMFSSSIPSALLPALPFGFFTTTLDYISPIVLQANSPPPNVTMSKYYFQDHLDEIKRKFEEVRNLGASTAEEWYKGLEGTGRERLADALRWERWDAEGGVQQVHAFRVARSKPPATYSPVATSLLHQPPSTLQLNTPSQPPALTSPAVTQPLTLSHLPPQPYQHGPPGFPLPYHPGFAPGMPQPAMQYGMATSGAQSSPVHLPPKPTTPIVPMSPATQFPPPFQIQQVPPRQMPISVPIQPHVPQARAERSIRDVNEAKAQRRADIERRCMELDPPIKPSTLIHMESFAAAIQIPMAMTDSAWEVLKPRLIAQKEVAESREKEQLQQSQLLHARTEERRQQEAALREAKENMDRQWDESQKPLRDKLNFYADEILRMQWANGENVNKDNCPQFAADVLTYVRRRFYQIQDWEDSIALQQGSLGQDHSNSGTPRKLTLENMKWVYETKLKPLTEPHSREIFLCNGCGNATKFYGFEGVIQHYAAKHTSLLSMGSIVVHWKADWPEDPPFDPNPIKSIAAANSQHPPQPSPQSTYAQSLGAQAIKQASPIDPQTYSQYSPPASDRPSYPPQSYSSSQYPQPVAPGSAYSNLGANVPQYPQNFGQRNASQQYNPQYPGSAWSAASQSPVDGRQPLSAGSPPQYGTAQAVWPPRQASIQQKTRQNPSARFGPPGQPFGIYQVQLEELSKNAREIYNATAAVKDLASSVRLHVIISHVVLRFKDRFTNEPTLSLFTDALNNSSQMKPLRNLSDLACKTCALMRPENVPEHEVEKLYTLPALLTHFQSVHIEQARPAIITQPGIEPPKTDWKFDMIKLPSNTEIAKLIEAPGMTDAKLKLIATILPWAFPSPLPEIGNREPYVEPSETPCGLVDGSGPSSVVSAANSGHQQPSMQPASFHLQTRYDAGSSSGLEVAVDDFPKFVESPMDEKAEEAEPAREDEYDPHRPAYVQPPFDSYGRFDPIKYRAKDLNSNSTPTTISANPHQFDTENVYMGDEHRTYGSRSDHNQSAGPLHTQRPQSISAAEQFLNSFDPNEDRDTYEPPEYVPPTRGSQSQSTRLYNAGVPQPQLPQQSQWNGSSNYGQANDWNRRGYEANQGIRVDDHQPGRQSTNQPTIGDQRRYVGGGAEGVYHLEQPPRRPSSRFGQYESDRQGSVRSRSRSPHISQPPAGASRYYRPRSPVREPTHAYRGPQFVRERDYYPPNDSIQYVQESPRQQYADRGYTGPAYDRPIEYIRMPAQETHGLPTVYLERHSQPSEPYVQYEEPVFEHNGQLYRRSQIPPDPNPERQYYR